MNDGFVSIGSEGTVGAPLKPDPRGTVGIPQVVLNCSGSGWVRASAQSLAARVSPGWGSCIALGESGREQKRWEAARHSFGRSEPS